MMSNRKAHAFGAENEDGEKVSNKRVKEETTSIDRLSALPDCLIFHILSFINFDAKEAAVTSVLSKRWQYLWSELPRLNFFNRTWDAQRTRDFVSWVHRTLLFRSGVNCLERFGFEFLYEDCYAPDVNAWVRFAVNSKVKDLSLELRSPRFFYTLPQVLYSNSYLTQLRIGRCIVAPQRTIEWQSLTRLDVRGVELQEHVIQKILSGCPVLYRLTLRSCWGFKRLDVNSQSLYELELYDCEDGDKNSVPLLEISAPHLRSLDIEFSPVGKKLQLTNIPSLVCAAIHFVSYNKSVEVMNNTVELFEKIQHTKHLILGGYFVEVLSLLVDDGQQLPQSRRDCLVLNTSRDEDSIPGIIGMLESSPNLETLIIESCDSYEKSVRTWNPAARDDLDCNLLHLKTIRLFDYADPNLAGEPMLTMARILLKRATTLKEMEIDAFENLTEFSSEFTKMSQAVLSYPRSSEKAVVVLHQ